MFSKISKRVRIYGLAVGMTAGLLAGGAGIASASTAGGSPSAPAAIKSAPANFFRATACPVHLNGTNTISLTFQGGTFTYPILLHVARDGDVTGVLFDRYLNGGTILRVRGNCRRLGVLLGVRYPLPNQQGFRAFALDLKPDAVNPTTQDDAAGVWTETGAEAGSGAASLVTPVPVS